MSGRTLDPSLLKAFVAVADLRSFTRSAVALNRTQSAISAQIKRLEDQIGLRLLDRSTAHVALTPAGESLVGYARRILSLSEEAMQRLAEHEVAGRVRIGVMDDYGTIVLPSLLKSFAVSYPGVEIHMETGLTSSMPERVGSDFDIVIAMHPPKEKSGTLLCREAAVWAGSAQFNVDDDNPLPVALYPSGCLFRKWALESLDRCGRAWRLAFVSHSLSAVEAIAARGLAVTVVKQGMLPASLTVFGRDQGLPRLPRAEVRLHTAPSLSPAAGLLASHLRDHWNTPRP
jgi:DNA-binding transcriptional LysR family regulator